MVSPSALAVPRLMTNSNNVQAQQPECEHREQPVC